MEKTTIGLIAALGAAAAASPAAASAPPSAADRILKPASLAELLEPVADPVATLKEMDARQLEPVEVADETVVYHHHHHHRVIIMRHHHHYHHHWHHHHHHHFY
jgi:hypothetical protein